MFGGMRKEAWYKETTKPDKKLNAKTKKKCNFKTKCSFKTHFMKGDGKQINQNTGNIIIITFYILKYIPKTKCNLKR